MIAQLRVSETRRPNARIWIWGALVFFVFGVLIVLGTWQVERLKWKEDLLQRIAAQLSQPPAPLATILNMYSSGEAIEYRPMSATGVFLHDRERHFFATHQGQSGFYIYTPFQTEDAGVLLVNRGFVPYDHKDPGTRADGQVAGRVTVTGLAREELTQKPSWIVPDNDPAKNIFYWKDREAMAHSAGLEADVLPFFLDVDAKANAGGLPIGGVTIVNLPNNHLQYVVTWYGLALTLIGISAAVVWRSKRR